MAPSPSFSLDLAEIGIGVPFPMLVAPDSAFVGEPCRITTIALIGRVRGRTDSVSRVVREMLRRSLRGSLAGTATPSLIVPRSGAE